ncbi:formate/nitrite transporter family protein [Aureimonas leprariae]|uniref:Formate/nitrite transporter family protein n=1 Tax=Plantimonas leprariae TaxID=2615207 RepID=A0A7V7PSE4_9HYPH|nr:formate/nitrite transporter family protein [Aureimonas leprariae]KAB0682063.1 formate/nitrite transporter family protein [Aureimonas leprariae]
MADADPSARAADDEARPSSALSEEEHGAVSDRKRGSARVVHETIRLQGDEELERPLTSLLLSGFSAGAAISVSLLAEAALQSRLPDVPWRELVVGFGYTAGFLIVILGRLQLFTESTVTAVLPLATHPTVRNVLRLAQLWSAVFAANLAGTLLVAWLIAHEVIVSREQLDAAITLSASLQEHDAWRTFLLAMPAGFLIASVAWILPSAKGSEFWVILTVTYLITLCGFTHVVAGSTEAWLLWLSGRASLSWALGDFVVPSLLGNIVGGTGLFAALAHGQVRGEL